MDHRKTTTKTKTKIKTKTVCANEPEKLPTSTATEEEVTPKMEDTFSKMEDSSSKIEETVPNVVDDSDSEEEDGEKLLDLAFAMDCTQSMSSQIRAAKEVGHIFLYIFPIRNSFWAQYYCYQSYLKK